MSKLLELYINGEKGGFHTLMSVSGVHRQPEPVTSADHQEMLVEALRLLDGGGYEGRLRIVDPSNVMVQARDGQSTLSTKQLRMFVNMPSGGALEPDPREHSTRPADETARMLGRVS